MEFFWIEFRPTKGVATKADICKLASSKFDKRVAKKERNGRYYQPFGSEEKAAQWIDNCKGKKLTKQYECRVFTDAQFSSRALNGGDVRFTEEQERNVVVIG